MAYKKYYKAMSAGRHDEAESLLEKYVESKKIMREKRKKKLAPKNKKTRGQRNDT